MLSNLNMEMQRVHKLLVSDGHFNLYTVSTSKIYTKHQ